MLFKASIQIPFYQTQWHGIDLIALAKKIRHPLQVAADAKFYEAFYQELFAKQNLSQGWQRKKRKISDWLLKQLYQYNLVDKKILSIGAGTGIVEEPLIDQGIEIDLHDVQPDSFFISGMNEKTNCYAMEICEISKKYDVLVCIAALYALSDSQITSFFSNCTNILKEKGIFIILDTSISWYEIYSWWRNKRFFSDNYLLWGKKRSIRTIMRYYRNFLLTKQVNFYNYDMQHLKVIRLLNIPFNVTPAWQSLVLEKLV